MSDQEQVINQPLRVIGLTSLFPNAWQPFAASFNRQQLDALAGQCRLSLVAPVFFTRLMGPKPGDEPKSPFDVARPIYWYTPGFMRARHGSFFLHSAWPSLRDAAKRLAPQAILATWAYPDGWAAMHAARRLGLPMVLKLHGSDINVQPQDSTRRPLISQTLAGADHVVAVSKDLAQKAIGLGAKAETTHVVPNGVDSTLFQPGEKVHCRSLLGLPQGSSVVLFVGHLVDIKDPLTVLGAVAALDDKAMLVMVGQGPLKDTIKQKAASLGLGKRLIMAGEQPLAQVPLYMASADCLCLASRAEGSPNVVREALSCGLPVAASDVGDIRLLLTDPILGHVCRPGDTASFSSAIRDIMAQKIPPQDIRNKAGIPSWRDSAGQLLAVLQEAATGR